MLKDLDAARQSSGSSGGGLVSVLLSMLEARASSHAGNVGSLSNGHAATAAPILSLRIEEQRQEMLMVARMLFFLCRDEGL